MFVVIAIALVLIACILLFGARAVRVVLAIPFIAIMFFLFYAYVSTHGGWGDVLFAAGIALIIMLAAGAIFFWVIAATQPDPHKVKNCVNCGKEYAWAMSDCPFCEKKIREGR